jgi:predicted Zn finger-like uncharacterized protein
MILTCPECATRYSVPDQSVGPEGRTVRCASCGLTWRTERDPALALRAPPAPLEELSPVLRGDELPRAFRERIAAQQRGRKVAASGALWAAVGVGAAAVLLLAVATRDDIARAWPKSASAFAAVGLPVNTVGLEIDNQVAQMGFNAEGEPVALVTGRLRNVRKRGVVAPPLRVDLLDAKEGVVATRIVRPLNAEIPAGEARTFTLSLENPPESTHNVDIGFHLGEAPAEHIAQPEAMRTADLRDGHAPEAAPDAGHAEAAH